MACMTELAAGVVAISRKTKPQGFPGKCHCCCCCCCCFSRLPGGTGLGQALGNSSKGMGGNTEAPVEKTVACKSYKLWIWVKCHINIKVAKVLFILISVSWHRRERRGFGMPSLQLLRNIPSKTCREILSLSGLGPILANSDFQIQVGEQLQGIILTLIRGMI